jgi:hypothetical protein
LLAIIYIIKEVIPKMHKSKKFILISVLVATVFIGGTIGAALSYDAVFAQDGPDGKRGTLISRVAQILGIGQQDIEDAFKQAKHELRSEALDSKLQEFVAASKITQAQADEYETWIDSRPDGIPRVKPETLQKLVEEGKLTQAQVDEYKLWAESKPDIPELWNAFKEDKIEKREAALNNRLQKLIEAGKITQTQADEFKAWTEAKPDDIPVVRPQMLPKLVEEGKITQEQADEYTKWLESKPDIPMPKLSKGNKGPKRFF